MSMIRAWRTGLPVSSYKTCPETEPVSAFLISRLPADDVVFGCSWQQAAAAKTIIRMELRHLISAYSLTLKGSYEFPVSSFKLPHSYSRGLEPRSGMYIHLPVPSGHRAAGRKNLH